MKPHIRRAPRAIQSLNDDEVDIALGLLAEILNELHGLRRALDLAIRQEPPDPDYLRPDDNDIPF